MGKVRYSLFLIICLVFGLIGAFNIAERYRINEGSLHLEFSGNSSIPPIATISGGGVTVCQNESPPPQITFTGDMGAPPYTFTYRVNGGAFQTVTTTGTNTSVSVNADISAVGTVTYTLVSVEDGNGDTENASGNVQITVIPSPDGLLGGTGSGTFFNGLPVFRQCISENSLFQFTNLSSTVALNTNYTISWGDGSPDFNQTTWTSTTHNFDVGIYNLVYTIEGSNG